jgi:hypothetical protein
MSLGSDLETQSICLAISVTIKHSRVLGMREIYPHLSGRCVGRNPAEAADDRAHRPLSSYDVIEEERALQ